MIQSALVQENADHILPDDVPVVAAENGEGASSAESEMADAAFAGTEEVQQTAEAVVETSTNR